jgi:general secretion pathway protein C
MHGGACVVLERLLKTRTWPLVLPPVVVIAVLHASAISDLVGVAMLPAPADLAVAPAARPLPGGASSGPTARSAEPILSRNPFDHVTGSLHPSLPAESSEASPASDTDPWSAPACDGIQVSVVVASDDPEWSFAGIATPKAKAALHRRGDELDGEKVVFVGADRVWFAHGGALCQAKVHDGKKVAAAPAPAASASSAPPARGASTVDPAIKKGIRKLSDTSFQIDRGVVDRILENQAELMKQARIVPEQENGRVVGIRLAGVRPDSLLSTLGMLNGDRLQTINGFEMANPEKALEAYARLRTADKLTIQLTRGGKAMNLDYDIR